MNKAEFVDQLSMKTKLSKTQSENVLDCALEIIKDTVKQGQDVKFVGFGTFDQSIRKARKGRNPKTGESIQIPKSIVPRFRPGKDFKELLKK